MPPQGYAGLGIFGWNLACAALGKPTVSRFCREHKVATGLAVAGFVWHIYFERCD